MRDILTGLAILAILLLSVLAVAPHFIDWDSYRPQIEDRASTAIGKPVKIAGPVNLRLLPAPVLRIGELRIGAADDHVSATAQKAKVELSITALLRGEFRITDATLEQPVLHVRADRPGAQNTVVVPTLQDIPLAAIENLAIVDGAVRHTALSGKQSQPVRGNFQVEAVSLKGPWRVAGRITAEERTYDIRLSTGAADAQERVPLKLSIADSGLAFIADLDGFAVPNTGRPGALPKIEGRVNASGTVAWPFGKQAGTQPWRLQAQGHSTEQGFTAASLEFEAGPAETPLRAEGKGELAIAEGWEARLALKARPIDIDKLRATDDRARAAPTQADAVAMMEQVLVAPPFPVLLALEGETIIANGEAVGPYRLDARLSRGRFRFERAEVSLPGQSRFQASGTAALAALPQFDGRVSLTSGNPAKFWSWANAAPVDPARTARFARLRDIALEADLSATPAVATAQDLKLLVDGATITGEARYRLARDGARARLDAAISADRLDIDLFPALQGPGGSVGRDYALSIDARQLTARSLGIESIGALAVVMRAEESGLQIERFDLRGGDAARISGAGKIGPAGGRIDSVIEAANIAPLLIAAQRLFPALQLDMTPARAALFNPARLTVSIEQASAREDVTAIVKGSLGATLVDANVGGPARRRPNDTWEAAIERGAVKLATSDFAQFLRQAGAISAAPALAGAPLPAAITIRSGAQHVPGADLRKRPDWILEGDVGGVAFSARGVATDGYVPTGNGPFTLDGADAAPLLRLLGVMEPAAQEKLPVSLKGHAEFGLGGLRAQNFTGSIGAKMLTGGMLHWPFLPDAKLRGNIAFAEFSLADLTAFLLGPDAASGTGLWPSGRFAAPRRPLADFDLEVTAAAMPFGALGVARNASMRIAAMPGGIRVPGFGADFGGGRLGFHMTFRHEGTLVAASGRIEATGVTPAAFGIRAMQGSADALLDVASVGETVTQIMQGLGGAGQINTRALRIDALDPAAAQRVLTQLQGKDAPAAPALAAQIEQELARGAWNLGTMTLPLTVTRGVARIGPAHTDLNGVLASGQLVADLRSAQLDATLTLGLRQGEAVAEQSLRWTGPLLAPRRTIDAAGVLNALQLAAIQRETERIGVLEQDARERAAFSRRARAERDQREREETRKREAEELQRRADAERQAAEDAIRRAEQERRTLEDMARRASETPPAPRAPAAPLAITPR